MSWRSRRRDRRELEAYERQHRTAMSEKAGERVPSEETPADTGSAETEEETP